MTEQVTVRESAGDWQDAYDLEVKVYERMIQFFEGQGDQVQVDNLRVGKTALSNLRTHVRELTERREAEASKGGHNGQKSARAAKEKATSAS